MSERYRVRYRACDRDSHRERMEAAAQEDARLHNGLIHHDDGRECAVVDDLDASHHETEAQP